jgi:heat shock protein HtpX
LYEQITANKWKSVLMMAFFFAFVVAIGYIIGLAWGGSSHPEYAFIGLGIAFTIAMVMNFISYYRSDTVALSIAGAKPVDEYMNDPNWRPIAMRFDNAVEGLAIAAGLPKPKPYIIYDEAPNAFATGRNPSHAAVAVTEGIMGLLSRDELEGVIAHELAHVQHRDILLGSIVATLAGAITMLARMLSFGAMFGGYGGSRDREGGGGLGLLVMAILAPIAAMLVQMWISRTREYGADAGGAGIAGTPQGLANALEKLESGTRQAPMNANPTSAHMFIVNPLSGRSLMSLFSTHPPIADRVARLRGMANAPK